MKKGTADDNRRIIAIALPMAFEGFASAGGDFADTLMVSRMGEDAVSAVGLGTQLFFVHLMLLYGFCGGASTYMAQLYGKGDFPGIKKTLSMTVAIAMSVSSVLFLLMLFRPHLLMGLYTDIDILRDTGSVYMRYRAPALLATGVLLPTIMALKSMQQIRIAVSVSLFAVGLNVALNYLLIFGKYGFPRLGVVGAAAATSLSTCIELGLLLVVLACGKHMLVRRLSEYRHWNRMHLKALVANSIPTTINEFMWSAGTSAYNAAYGRVSVTAMAAAEAADIIAHVFTKSIYSVGDAALVLVGEQLGKDDIAAGNRLARSFLKLSVLLGVTGGLILIVISGPIADWFAFSEEGTRSLHLILMIYGAFMWLKVYNATLVTGILRAGGDVRFAMVTEVSTIWCIGVPIVFLTALYFRLPIYWVILFVQMEDAVKALILTARFRSRKWLNNKVKDLVT